jgi:hypothetical protein
VPKKKLTIPHRLPGKEKWTGWVESDFGYPLVNYVRSGDKIRCAWLTEGELKERPGTRWDIMRTRMVVQRTKLREDIAREKRLCTGDCTGTCDCWR